MKVVVAGGTGFLGRHIAGALLDDGHEVSVLGRNRAKVATIPMLAGAGAIEADVTDRTALAGTLDGADAVVGCVQFPNHPVEVPRRGLTYDRFDRMGTEHLVDEAIRAGVARYVYLSGAGADATSATPWYRAKGRAEAAIRESGIAHVVFRPSWAYGPEDRALNRFAAIARFSPVIPRIGVAPQLIQPVHVDDIAAAVRLAFGNDASWNQTFELGSRAVMTMNDVIRTMLDLMGLRRLVVPVPRPLVKLAVWPLRALPSPFMTPAGIDFAAQDGLVDAERAEKVLGWTARDLRAGLASYLTRR